MYVIKIGHQEEQEGGRKCNGQRSRRRTLWMKEDKDTQNYEESDRSGETEKLAISAKQWILYRLTEESTG